MPLVYISWIGSSSPTSTSGGDGVVVGEPVLDGVPPGGRRGAGQADPAPHRRAVADAEGLVDHRSQGVLGDDPGGAGVVEDEGHLVGVEHEVDRHRDRAEPGQGEVDDDELPAVVGEDGDAVAAPDTPGGEGVGGAVDDVVELAERLGPVAPDQRRPVRGARRGAGQQVGEAVAAGGGDRGGQVVGGTGRLGHVDDGNPAARACPDGLRPGPARAGAAGGVETTLRRRPRR